MIPALETAFAPDALYWVFSPDGPTWEGTIASVSIRNGFTGPISGQLAERICARGFRAYRYQVGSEPAGWIEHHSAGPGWFLLVSSPPRLRDSISDTPDRPFFPSASTLTWPEKLPADWLAMLRQYDRRSGERTQ